MSRNTNRGGGGGGEKGDEEISEEKRKSQRREGKRKRSRSVLCDNTPPPEASTPSYRTSHSTLNCMFKFSQILNINILLKDSNLAQHFRNLSMVTSHTQLCVSVVASSFPPPAKHQKCYLLQVQAFLSASYCTMQAVLRQVD